MRPLIILALLTIACDTPPIEGPPGPAGPKGDPGAVGPAGPAGGSTVKSGTRLKARVARSDDGASQFLGWWDSELGMRCARNSSLGRDPERCFPSVLIGALVDGDDVYFADSACTVRAARASPQNHHEGIAFCVLRDEADVGRWHPLGDVVTNIYRTTGDGPCELATDRAAAASEGYTFHSCGDLAEVPAQSFVAMPEILEP